MNGERNRHPQALQCAFRILDKLCELLLTKVKVINCRSCFQALHSAPSDLLGGFHETASCRIATLSCLSVIALCQAPRASPTPRMLAISILQPRVAKCFIPGILGHH